MWNESDKNIAGESLSYVSPTTLKFMNRDLVANHTRLLVRGCLETTLTGKRARVCVPKEQFNAERKYWRLEDQRRDPNKAKAEINARNKKYWEEFGTKPGRQNHSILAHHVAAHSKHGAPPPGTTASHLCGNPKCCNADHLEWEPMQYNATRNYCTYMARANPCYNKDVHCLHNPKCVV